MIDDGWRTVVGGTHNDVVFHTAVAVPTLPRSTQTTVVVIGWSVVVDSETRFTASLDWVWFEADVEVREVDSGDWPRSGGFDVACDLAGAVDIPGDDPPRADRDQV